VIDLLDRRAVRVLTTALIFVGVLFFIYKVHETLILFLFALLFAYLFEPVVCRVQPLVRNSRALAILIVYILLFFILTMTGMLLGPRIFSEGQKLGQSLPTLYERVRLELRNLEPPAGFPGVAPAADRDRNQPQRREDGVSADERRVDRDHSHPWRVLSQR
jgi:predicted PurR-regulated permease PerM